MSGHTQGTWVAHANGDWFYIRAHTKDVVVTVASCETLGPKCEANARLIAAAPELKDVVKECEATFATWIEAATTDGGATNEELANLTTAVWEKCKAVLAKAEGRQP